MFFAGSRNRGARWKDEGGSPLPWRPFIDAVGSGISASDDAALARTLISVAGGGSTDFAAMGIYRPQDYGTIDPTGAADSSAAFQAALDAMNASPYGGVVLCPRGRFKIATGLSLPDMGYDSTHGWGYQVGRAIRGPAWGSCTLVAASGLTAPILTATGNTIAGLPNFEISDIAFNGNANTGMTNGVVKLDRTAWAYLHRVVILGATGGSSLAPIGLNVLDVVHGVYENVNIANCQTGWKFTQPNSMTCNHTVIRSGWAVGCTSWGVDIQSGSPFLIQGMDLEANGAGIRYAYSGGHITIQGPLYHEGISSGAMFDLDTGYARIEGPIHGIMGGIQNRGTTNLVVEDWIDATTCTNAAGAVLNKVRCPGLTGSGGTTNTWHS